MQFSYQARTKEGEVKSGIIESSSREAALNLLQHYGFYVTALEETEALPFYARRIKFFDRVSRKEIVLFSRQLAIMFKSQIPLAEALRTLAAQTKKLNFREKLYKFIEDIEAGTPFSSALSRYPKLFSQLYVATVKSGELAGRLSDILEYLADHEEREYHLRAKIKSALIYPCLIIFVAAAVLIMLTWFVIPNLEKVLSAAGQQIPLATRIIIGFADFMKKWGWLLILSLFCLIIVMFRYYRTKEGKKLFHRFVLKIPLLGEFLKMVYLSRFAENLSTLISSGLPIARALQVSGNIIGNVIYREIILFAREGVRKGVPVSAVLNRHPEMFPAMFCQMIMVGEKTGTLDKTLMEVVGFYQKEVDRAIANLLSILEPVLIIVLGLIVGGLMAAILLPLYNAMTM